MKEYDFNINKYKITIVKVIYNYDKLLKYFWKFPNKRKYNYSNKFASKLNSIKN